MAVAETRDELRELDPEVVDPDALAQRGSDRIETAVQQLGQVKRVVSRSARGFSTVTVTVKSPVDV